MPKLVEGGDKWKKLIAEKYGKEPVLKVGIFAGATYQGEYGSKEGQSVAEVAYWNEYGTSKNENARPFFQSTIDKHADEWMEAVEVLMKQGYSARDVLEIVGQNATADIVNNIKEGVGDPPSEATLADRERRGLTSKTQLMATMTMINAITHEVEE